MKQIMVLLMAAAAFISCDITKTPIFMEEVVNEKIKIDATENPAKKFIIKEDLANRRITLIDVTVKDVINSNNIDYEYCVKADVQTKKGMVECCIYTTNVKTVAKLVKGRTKIDVKGVFGRFFSTLDDYYAKVDIIRASITIK